MSVNDVVLQQLFDESGRRIPPDGIGAPVNKADTRYALAQPSIDFAAIHGSITEFVGGTGVAPAREFEDRAEALLARIRSNEDVAALVGGVHVPFVLAAGAPADLGKAFETVYLPGLARAWKSRFPKYDFKSELTSLTGKISIARGSRYERLIEAMSEGSVVGWYFPLALSGYSVEAALQQMSGLPEAFVLAGGLEAASALAGCPDLIMKVDGYAPQLDLSGWRASVDRYAFHFAPYGYNLTFNGRYHQGLASDYCASGLTVLAASRKKL